MVLENVKCLLSTTHITICSLYTHDNHAKSEKIEYDLAEKPYF